MSAFVIQYHCNYCVYISTICSSISQSSTILVFLQSAFLSFIMQTRCSKPFDKIRNQLCVMMFVALKNFAFLFYSWKFSFYADVAEYERQVIIEWRQPRNQCLYDFYSSTTMRMIQTTQEAICIGKRTKLYILVGQLERGNLLDKLDIGLKNGFKYANWMQQPNTGQKVEELFSARNRTKCLLFVWQLFQHYGSML